MRKTETDVPTSNTSNTSSTPGKKYDREKPRWDLLPLRILTPVVEVLTFGASKYGPNNWQNLVDFEARYTAALCRHLAAWQSGERLDPESGLPHLAHMICNLIFLLWKETPHESKLSIGKDTPN